MHWIAAQPRSALVMAAVFLLADIPVVYLVFRILFPTWDELREALAYWLKPDIFSWIQGEGWDDCWAEIKLGVFISATCGLLALEVYLLTHRFGMALPGAILSGLENGAMGL